LNILSQKIIFFTSNVLLIFLISFPNLLVTLDDEKPENLENHSIGIPSSVKSRTPYLFSYQKGEKDYFEKLFDQNGYGVPRFFENVLVGMISLTETELTVLKKDFGKIAPHLQASKLKNVLPSVEELTLKKIQVGQQNYELPRDIINTLPLTSAGYDGSGVKIAVLDSGLDDSHSAFANIGYQESFILPEYGYSSEEGIYDLHGHGTHVAGIAVGGGSFPGIAPGSEVVNLKVADMFGSSSSSAVIAALDEAVEQNVNVVSISLGFGLTSPWESEDILAQAVNTVVDHGITVVTAAGNEADGSIPFMTINTPASAKKSLTVGASNGSNNVVYFSSQGPTYDFRPDPDIIAPGYQIVGPLASGGVMDLAYNALVDVSISDYIILSGTSMATPVVSGAVALLLDQFPDASPYAIRAALQESASDLGDSETIYTQGSGLINVGSAAEKLRNSQISSGYEIISSIPRAYEDGIEFFQPISFPGDHVEMSIPFVTGTGGTISWEISEDLIPFIDFNTTPATFSSAAYFERILKLDIPYNVPPAFYEGYLGYTFGVQSYQLPITFEVQLPKEKIYWDTYHTGIDDSYFLNYHSLNQILQSSSYQYDIVDYNSPISDANLSQNGIIVLTDLEDPLTYREIEFIKDFHEKNGSILLVTSFLPYFNLDPYEKLVDGLNLPINLSDRTELVNYFDDGRERFPVSKYRTMTDLIKNNENPFFTGVDDLPRLGGTAFYGNISDASLTHYAQLDTQLVLAGLEPEGKGKILILGSKEWISPSYLRSTSGQIFVSNILDWLSPPQVTFNAHLDTNSNALEIALYPSSIQNFFLTIEFANGSIIHDIAIPYNNTLGFSYLNFSIEGVEGTNMRLGLAGTIPGELNINLSLLLHTTQVPLIEEIEVVTLSSSNISVPSWWEESGLLIDEGLEVTVTHTSSLNVSANLIISSQYEDSLDVLIPPLDSKIYTTSYTSEISLANDTLESKSVSWLIPNNLHTGYYSYEVQVWWKNEQNQAILLNAVREFFYIPDDEPEILASQSYIDDLSVEDHQELLTLQDLPKWKASEEIEISLKLEDSTSEDFEVYYQLLHYYLFAADRVVFDTFTLYPSISDSSIHSGIFTVPDLPIPLPDEEDLEVKIKGEYFILLFFIRDTQGNSILEPVFFQISNPSLIDIPLVILIVVFSLGVTVGIIYVIRRNERKRYDPFSYRIQPSQEFTAKPQVPSYKYCIQCGSQMPMEAKFCSNCGRTIDFEPQ
jgi:hypothetical protein